MIFLKTLVLDNQKIKDQYTLRENENGTFSLFLPLTVTGDTGKPFKLTGHVLVLAPPEGFEDMLMVIEKTVEGRGSSKYFRESLNALTTKLNSYLYDMPAIDLDKENYVGVLKNNNEKNQTEYKPYILRPAPETLKPVITERTTKQKTYSYFRIDKQYYQVTADPLHDVSSGNSITIKEELLQVLQKELPVVGYDEHILSNYPLYIYKGYAPIYYYAEDIYFNKSYSERSEIIVRKDKQRGYSFSSTFVPGYNTFNEFLYVFEEKFPQCKKQLTIYDESFYGESLEEFPIKSIVRVANPSEKHAPIENLEGVVLGKVGTNVEVQFLNYFKEKFDPTELIKI